MAYEKNGEWNGYTIKESATGWTIDKWSREQGGMNGKKVLVPFGVFGYQKGQDLKAQHNDIFEVGEIIYDYANGNPELVKVLRKGEKVQ